MTSLFGRMLPLFVGVRRVEDLFTEAIAHLFERRPDVCLEWLEEIGVISPSDEGTYRFVQRVSTQKSFVALEDHDTGSRPDMIIEVGYVSEDEDAEPNTELVMIESKLGSWEGPEQLRRYATHLETLSGCRKTLLYITRAYDPKGETEILSEVQDVNFLQLRWHDFYKFLQKTEKDALVEEVMLFMEEQGMSQSHRLSTTDLMALSGVPRAFEIFTEALEGEVRNELERFTGNSVSRRDWLVRQQIINHKRYIIFAPFDGGILSCYLGFVFGASSDFAELKVYLETGAKESQARNASIDAMRRVSQRCGWRGLNLNEKSGWAAIEKERSLADFLPEEDHIYAIKRFFIESIHQLRDELTEFKKENPDLPWSGGN